MNKFKKYILTILCVSLLIMTTLSMVKSDLEIINRQHFATDNPIGEADPSMLERVGVTAKNQPVRVNSLTRNVMASKFNPPLQETFSYHNNSPMFWYPSMEAGDVESVWFWPEHPCQILKVRLHTSGPSGWVTLGVWPAFGGSMPDVENPYKPFTIMRVYATSGTWSEYDMKPDNVFLSNQEKFHVGIIRSTGGPGLTLDDTPVSDTHSTLWDSGATPGFPWDNWFVPSDGTNLLEYCLEIDVQYFDVADTYTFSDVTSFTGLGEDGNAAWGDYNNDGLQDCLLWGEELYRNNGDGTFTDVSAAAGIAAAFTWSGTWGDYDNDGYLDFYAVGDGPANDHLYHNNGDGTFTDVTVSAGNVTDDSPSISCAWGDYDADGYIDIYVANFENCQNCTLTLPPGITDPCDPDPTNPCALAWGDPDHLWHNNGDGTFTDVTASSGIDAAQGRPDGDSHCGRGVSWADFDEDGDLDVYISNHRLDPNLLFQNNNDGTFTNVANDKGVRGYNISGAYGHTFGSAWGDYDNDGNMDLLCGNLAHPRFINFSDKIYLFHSDGPPDYTFTDMYDSSGFIYEETQSDISFGDYDNDGWLDIHIVSIYVGRKSTMYHNNQDGTFSLVNYPSGAVVDNGWWTTWVDYDMDGFLDLYAHRLYRNHGNSNNWIIVQPVATVSNKASIGAHVTITTGGMSQMRDILGGTGQGHQPPLYARFGVGTVTKIDNITVVWPNGRTQTILNVDVNQVITITEP